MPNGLTHSFAGGLTGLAIAALDRDSGGNIQHNPFVSISIGAAAGKLPDILEPSLRNPHHRQFFHSVFILASTGYATKKVYDWKPNTKWEAITRSIILCAGVGFISHLLLDAMTSRSLPVLGKI